MKHQPFIKQYVLALEIFNNNDQHLNTYECILKFSLII